MKFEKEDREHPEVIAILQARFSSKRFPGKVLSDLNGRPMLHWTLESLRRARELKKIILATSWERDDDAVAGFGEREGVSVFRGPLEDVAARFRGVLERCPAEYFVRVNGDSPLLDYRLVDLLVREFRRREVDIVTNVLRRSFPKGESVEVVRTRVFVEWSAQWTEKEDKEHVTRYFYRHAGRFRIHNIAAPADFSSCDLSVDREEQLERLRKIFTSLEREPWEYGWEYWVKRMGLERRDGGEEEEEKK
ncbi:MAG: hypothetical protein D6679_08570 [Candidatus Hydrogenedentota bacterium]|nr:MAG: hypothetical protein D6679_08570 [Candidatus Hydrogenedentota bacterium]